MFTRPLALAMLAAGCGASSTPVDRTAPPSTTDHATPASRPTSYRVVDLALPGGSADGVGMDYLAYDPRTKAVWVPAGNTGAVDVIDVATQKLARVEGFPTQEMERRGKKRVVGPSSAAIGGAGVVYVGNRGDSTVCAVDDKTLVKGACGTLDSMPDGIAYVAATKEVWVTTPRDKSIRILDATTLAQKDKIVFDGDPEGFAVDPTRSHFYTNLEDKDVTLSIDLLTRRTLETWKPECGEDGPHGLRFSDKDGLLFVACSARVEAIDVAHGGAIVGKLDTADGVDDLDYADATHTLYVAGAKAAKLDVIAVGAGGALAAATSVATKQGARNGVVDGDGRVYLAHSAGSEILVVTPN